MLISKPESIKGNLLGCAIGDALGLHKEGLTSRRANKMFPDQNRYYLIGKYGFTSDDFDHASITLEALCASGNNTSQFARELGNRVKVWAACIPGGIGLATLKSSFKLWLGISPHHSGVYSAGNGPAMRSHVIGTCIHDTQQLIDFVRASTLISHTDPKAFTGALVITLASRHSSTAAKVDPDVFFKETTDALHRANGEPSCIAILESVATSIGHSETTAEFVKRFGSKGISGYIYHTMPAVIHAWLSYPESFETALKTIIACGGDADTTGSILGGIIGSRVGIQGIPSHWIKNLILWPRSIQQTEFLASHLVNGTKVDSKVTAWQYLLRNTVFDPLVLCHGIRRLFPPY